MQTFAWRKRVAIISRVDCVTETRVKRKQMLSCCKIIDTFVTSGMIVHIGLLPERLFLEPMNLKQGDNMLTSVVVQEFMHVLGILIS